MSDLHFARLQVPATYIAALPKESSRNLFNMYNGQLVNVESGLGIYGLRPDQKIAVTPLGGIQDEGQELYVTEECLQEISDQDNYIAELLYHSFWQREKYTESVEEIFNEVMHTAGEIVSANKNGQTINCTHISRNGRAYTSEWTKQLDNCWVCIINEPFSNEWLSKRTTCFRTTVPDSWVPEHVWDCLAGS